MEVRCLTFTHPKLKEVRPAEVDVAQATLQQAVFAANLAVANYCMLELLP